MTDLDRAKEHLCCGWEHLTNARRAISEALILAGKAPEFRDLVQPLYGLRRELDAIERAHVGLLTTNEAVRQRRAA